jgi:ATP-dependent phosphoenolpyruvate carboxykinase
MLVDAAIFFGLSGTGKILYLLIKRKLVVMMNTAGPVEGCVHHNFEVKHTLKVINLSENELPNIFQNH